MRLATRYFCGAIRRIIRGVTSNKFSFVSSHLTWGKCLIAYHNISIPIRGFYCTRSHLCLTTTRQSSNNQQSKNYLFHSLYFTQIYKNLINA